MKWQSPLRSGFRKLVPDFQRLWSGPMCSCLWFTCSLASDRHCALWFVSSCLILISFSFGTSVRLCLVIVIFPRFFTYSFVYCLSWCVCLCFWCYWQAIFCNIGNLWNGPQQYCWDVKHLRTLNSHPLDPIGLQLHNRLQWERWTKFQQAFKHQSQQIKQKSLIVHL